jgi:anti-anti-sigma factor
MAEMTGIAGTNGESRSAGRAGPDNLRIDARLQDDELVLALHGEADMSTAPVLANALGDASINGRRRVVLDLEALEFIDARCLGMMITTHDALVATGADFVLRHPSPLVLRLLRIFDCEIAVESS